MLIFAPIAAEAFTGKAISLRRNAATPGSCGLATGGTISTSGGYRIHAFTTGGVFSPDTTPCEVETLVAGGGGGTSGTGGGGAGGLKDSIDNAQTINGNVTVSVGFGGVRGCGACASSGSQSVFGSTTAAGGGRGGGGEMSCLAGASGGSGGGGSGNTADPSGGAGTAGQGSNGGNGLYDGELGGGGGGGRGAAGQHAVSGTAGGGGAGYAGSITGAGTGYAGGGGGGRYPSSGTAGAATHGGGAGSVYPGACGNGAANTGGGAGGRAFAGGEDCGCDGGSGVVIVRYVYP